MKFKRLHPDAVLPTRAHPTDAGLDITFLNSWFDEYNKVTVYHTGLAVEIPKNYVGLLFPRSSIYKTQLMLSNSVGVIDSDYRGEIKAIFRCVYKYNDLSRDYSLDYQLGHKGLQLVVVPIALVDAEWADELSATERGEKGFGSSGQ